MSAWIFILVSTVLLADAAVRLHQWRREDSVLAHWCWISQHSSIPRDIGYGDDMLLVDTILYILQRWLWCVEEEVVRYDWTLEKDKVGHLIFTGGNRDAGGLVINERRTQAAHKGTLTKAFNRAQERGDDPHVAMEEARAKQELRAAEEVARGGRFAQAPGSTESAFSRKDVSGRLRFRNGTLVPRIRAAKYLGVRVNENLENREELMARGQGTLTSLAAYRAVYKGSKARPRRKIQLFQAVQKKVLAFAGQLQNYVPRDEQRLLTVQVYCLKRALQRPTWYETGKTCSNAQVLEDAGVDSVLDELKVLRLKMFGHVARHPDGPAGAVSFTPSEADPLARRRWTGQRRQTWHRRTFWLERTLAEAREVATACNKPLVELVMERKVWHWALRETILTSTRARRNIILHAWAQRCSVPGCQSGGQLIIPPAQGLKTSIPPDIESVDTRWKVGIDEAGRGAVVGNMVYGLCGAPIDKDLSSFGFRDSKEMTVTERNHCMALMRQERNGFLWAVHEISPADMDRQMPFGRDYTLDLLAHDSIMALVDTVLAAGADIDELYVDTVGPPATLRMKLEVAFPEIANITVEAKADTRYPVVSAASVVAKVHRDQNVLELQRELEDGARMGTGYPADKETSSWLLRTFERTRTFPRAVRMAWRSVRRLLPDQKVPVPFELQGHHQATLDPVLRAIPLPKAPRSGKGRGRGGRGGGRGRGRAGKPEDEVQAAVAWLSSRLEENVDGGVPPVDYDGIPLAPPVHRHLPTGSNICSKFPWYGGGVARLQQAAARLGAELTRRPFGGASQAAAAAAARSRINLDRPFVWETEADGMNSGDPPGALSSRPVTGSADLDDIFSDFVQKEHEQVDESNDLDREWAFWAAP